MGKKFLIQSTKKVVSQMLEITFIFLRAEQNLSNLNDKKSFIIESTSYSTHISTNIKNQPIKSKKKLNKISFSKLKNFKKRITKYVLSSEFQLGLKFSTLVLFIMALTIRPVWAANNTKKRTWKKFFLESLSYSKWRNYLLEKNEYTNLTRISLVISGFVTASIVLTIINMSLPSVALYVCQDNLAILNELNTSLQDTIEILMFKYQQSRDRHLRTYEDLKIVYELLKISSLKSGIEIPGELPPPPIYNLELP
jgi:hypothetical protein